MHRDGAHESLSNEMCSSTVGCGKAMKVKSAILDVTCATAVLGVAIWLALGHQARLRLREENKTLRQQLAQMASLGAENERLSNLVSGVSRSRSVSNDQLRELLRLRGEVGVLREQSKELETLRKENRQVSTSLDSSLKAQSAAPAGAAANADYWPRESWAFAGYASPDAALQSSFWAANKGDVKTFVGGIEGEILQKVQKDFEGKSEDEISAKAIAEVASLKSVRILNREARAEDTVVLTAEFEEGNTTHTTKLLMKKFGDDWKLSGHL
jgi:hypothetical protein